MRVRVRYFAVLRDRAGVAEEWVETHASTARDLVDELLAARDFGLPGYLMRVAINGEFVDDGHALADEDEVVLIPPVSGG